MSAPNPEEFMQMALSLARTAEDLSEVPIGCIIIKGTTIISSGFNQKEKLGDPTAHAEIIAIQAAAKVLGNWRLTDCEMYTTLEPCIMCAGAIIHARLRKLHIATTDPKAGAMGSLYQIHDDIRLNHRVEVTRGLLAKECSEMLSAFFVKRRS